MTNSIIKRLKPYSVKMAMVKFTSDECSILGIEPDDTVEFTAKVIKKGGGK